MADGAIKPTVGSVLMISPALQRVPRPSASEDRRLLEEHTTFVRERA